MTVIFDSLVADTIFVSVILAVFYWLMDRTFNYWEKRGVRSTLHSTSQWSFLRRLDSILFLRYNLTMALYKKHEQMAGEPFFGIYYLNKPLLVVRDLDLVKAILVKDAHVFLERSFLIQEDKKSLRSKTLSNLTGTRWRHMRTKLTPAFSSGKIKRMFYLVDKCAKQLTSHLEKEALSGGIVDVRECLIRYGIDVIALCAFGVDTNSLTDPDCKFRSVIRNIRKYDTFSKKLVATIAFIAPSLAKFFGIQFIPKSVENFFRNLFWSTVEDRKKTGVVRNDYVDLLMKLKDEGLPQQEDTVDVQETDQLNESVYGNRNTDIKLEDDDIVAQAVVFLLAGLAGPASVATFTLYEMVQNPDIQDKLRREITTVIDKHDGQVSYEAIAEMSYLDMVISESLRKYPLVGILERKCLVDYKLPGTEIVIEAGTGVLFSVKGLQFDPQIYPDPQKYDPERFNAENRSKRSPYAFVSFGAGPRNCIGMRFALMQMKVTLVNIIMTYEVRACAETPRLPLRFRSNSFGFENQDKICVSLKKLDC